MKTINNEIDIIHDNIMFDLKNQIEDLINNNSCINRSDILLDIFLGLNENKNFANYFSDWVESESNVFKLELIKNKLQNEIFERKGVIK